MPEDPIHDAAVAAVSQALDLACETNNILPPRDITAHLWAESMLAESLKQGRLPSQVDLNRMLLGVPPLFISDRNR
jgi:hypothetical protein